MKILLCAVNTKYIHSNAAVRLLASYTQKYLESHPECAAHGPEIKIREYTINQTLDEVLSGIFLEQADVVMFSCYIWNWHFIRLLLPELKKVLPSVDLWLGGPEVSFTSQEVLLEHPEVLGILRGEGEETFREIVLCYYASRSKDLEDIPGISFRSLAGIQENKDRELLNLDEVPFIYSEEKLSSFDHKILYYESQRGCPFSCAYCLSSLDKRVRFRSLSLVRSELQFFLDHRVPQVKFVDRTFNTDRRHSEGILAYLAEHDNGVTNFHFEVEGDILSAQEMELLLTLRPGQVQLEIGVQSINPQTLHAVNRKTDLNRLAENVRRILNARNIHIHLDLIAGLPYEDYESFARSFNWVYALRPEQLQLGFLKVLKGSPMHRFAESWGIVYQDRPPYEVLHTRWISYGELIRLKKVESMLDIYYNSNQFTKTLEVLERAFPSPFALYEALADYYEEQGYFLQTPSRLYRYQVLLEFASEKKHLHRELFQELLTYDLYLRENLKSRPSFAADLSKWQEEIRRLYRGRANHVDVFWYSLQERDAEKIMQRRKEPLFLLFNYDQRDPMDHNALVQILT